MRPIISPNARKWMAPESGYGPWPGTCGYYRQIGQAQFFCDSDTGDLRVLWDKTLLETGEPSENLADFSEYSVRPRMLGPRMFSYDLEGIALNAGAIEVSSGDKKQRIPLASFTLMDSTNCFTHAFSKGRLWLACYAPLSTNATLDCYVFGEEKRQWQANVWGFVNELPGSYVNSFHRSQVITSDRIVYLVGIGSWGPHIEGFDVNEGSVRLRFVSTTLLHPKN